VALITVLVASAKLRTVQRSESDGICVAGEEQRVRVHQPVEDQPLIGPDCALFDVAPAQCFHRSCWNEIEEDLDAAEQIEIVIEGLRRYGGRHTINEL
jgi:hypothetical protein